MPAPRPLVLERITKAYPSPAGAVEALRGVDLALEAGEWVALMGPSGGGKSTLLHLAGLVDEPSSGCIWLEGRQVEGATDAERTRLRRERLGFVFQQGHLLPMLSLAENVALPLALSGGRRSEHLASARALLTRLGLEGLGDRLPHEVSGGQAQRAALARAVLHRPALILADEPTGALDRASGAEVLRLLGELAREEGAAILMATHDPEAAAAAHRAVRLVDGRLQGA